MPGIIQVIKYEGDNLTFVWKHPHGRSCHAESGSSDDDFRQWAGDEQLQRHHPKQHCTG